MPEKIENIISEQRFMIEKKSPHQAATTVSFLQPGLGRRIDIACKKIGGRSEAAAAAGVSEVMLRTYIREDSSPRFDAMVNLAGAAGVDLVWLATGEGSDDQESVTAAEAKSAEEDSAGMIKLSVQALEEWLLEENLELDPERKAEVVVVLYRYLRSRNTVNPQEIASLLQALAA
ncbi:helix-turn-helix domain-containing protein [Chromobacterium haemolyticum]|uniref:helix-turn-helix domain-containing protein n=1 Tax=Chromobacterium haemolyticum TaxID=394935 RepID=UPI0013B3F59D|nr:helix-turn-helix domain-containing protein [Chromobacterium haemolyticum]